MNTKPDFSFDRTLTDEELNFWSTFFDHCPFGDYIYTQGIISAFAKETKINLNLEEYYLKIKEFKNNDKLIELFNNSDLSVSFKDYYPRAINKLDKIFPNSKPLNLFFMSLYSGFCQNMNFELTAQGVNLLPNRRPTHVVELALLVDLMGGRANQLFPHLDIKPVKLTGENTYKQDKSEEIYTLTIEGSLVKRSADKINKGTYEFAYEVAYDFSKNTNTKLEIHAPLAFEQENFLKLVEKNYLESILQVNKTSYNNKIKI
jgi:hypothetical protein